MLDVLVGGVTPNKQVVLVRATEGGEPVTGEFRIHNALEDLGAGARALRETIVVKQFIFPPELEVFAVRLGDGDLIVARLEVHESENLGVLGTVQEVFCEGEEIGILFDGFIEAAKICDEVGGAPRAILVLLGREMVVGSILVGCGGGGDLAMMPAARSSSQCSFWTSRWASLRRRGSSKMRLVCLRVTEAGPSGPL